MNLTGQVLVNFQETNTILSEIFKATQLSLGGWINLDSKIG